MMTQDVMPTPEAGFSLLEALIALSILAIAAAALIGASEAHIDRVAGLEERTIASWVAEERLAELRLGPSSAASSSETRVMAGRTWQIEVSTAATDDPDLIRADISVKDPAGRSTQTRLTGFIDAGAGR